VLKEGILEFIGIGPGELLLIFVVALIVFGPRRLREIGRVLGKGIRQFRQLSQEFNTQLSSELQAASEEVQAISEDFQDESFGGAGGLGRGAEELEG
jgi:sec-independent protein translocase protein TatA